MRKLIGHIDNLTIRTKLVITFVILITLPMVVIGGIYFATSTNVVSDIVEGNTYELVKKNNEIIDIKLSHIMSNMTSFIADEDFVNALDEVNPDNNYSIMLADNRITQCLNKYFLQSQDLYSVQLATSYFMFGPRPLAMTTVKSLIPKDNFIDSEIYHIAKENSGKIQWIPTYDFGQMFRVPYLTDLDVDYKNMFSSVVEINGSFYQDGLSTSIPADSEKPFLILNFKEDFFQQVYQNSISSEGSYYFVITQDGQIVSHKNQDMITKKVDLPWLKELMIRDSGSNIVEIDGKKMIACYSTSSVTGWVSVVVIPPSPLVKPIISVLSSYTVYIGIVLTLLSLLIAYFISMRITNPINKLIKAIKRTGEGNFDLKIQEEGGIESKDLIRMFNLMNERIHKLIKEKYEIEIKEKEAEITALNLQLNPHFMYNTLNMISLISLENGQDEISDMLISLSKMLKYSVKTSKNLAPFKMDIEYLKSYIHIMAKRFEGKFVVVYDIDPKLNDYVVPKFFLQPFVENSLLHGFESLGRLGVLRITCIMEGQLGYFCIEDNGNGMDAQMISQSIDSDTSIGIQNVNKRIKIIYGDQYGVRIDSTIGLGTKVSISIPLLVDSI